MLMHELLLRGAERRPDKTAFTWVDRQRSLTYAEAVSAMEDVAGALAHLGIGKGDRVTIIAHNGLDYLTAMLGAWRLGAISALVNVKFANDFEYYLGDHQPAVIVYTHDMHDAVAGAARAVGGVKHLVCMDGPKEGAQSLPELVAARLACPPDPSDSDAIAHLSYTSGTTGNPKGACLAHEPTVRATRCIAERMRIREGDVSFGPTALSSSFQLVANLLPHLDRMATINVMGRWTQESGWQAIEAAGVTALIANPPILEEVLAESAKQGKTPGKLRMSVSGGGPVPPTLKQGWRDKLATPLVESYGQSELGGFVALGYPESEADDRRLMRVGPPLPDKIVAIFDLHDRPQPINTVGEIVISGGFMRGYWNKPEKTADATRGGWLHTGDIGLIDEDGYVLMRGRRSELIDVAGVSWFPRDVEEALCRQVGIRQAAVIGLPDDRLGQRPAAFVTVQDGQKISADKLRRAIAGEVSYDIGTMEIHVLDALPMTPTGKISKAALIAQVTLPS